MPHHDHQTEPPQADFLEVLTELPHRAIDSSVLVAEYARRHCLSQRAINDLLSLLHAGFDFSMVKTHEDVWQKSQSALTTLTEICRSCGSLDICDQDW